MNRQHEIEQLQAGQTVSFRPVGNSMVPRIKSKQLVTFSPDISNIEVGDIVLWNPIGMPFMVCKTCGNKRCPKATDCSLECTNSNQPGQAGSIYG